ncbi:MAG: SRPBCC family protein [Nevskiaceae bacterium]
MFNKVAVAIALLIAILAAVGLVLPKTAHVERSIAIDAPPVMVFTVLNGFRQFSKWSPWADIDPDAITTLDGPATGVGAHMSWSGNAEVGTGSQEILESTSPSAIRLRLTFGDFPGDFETTYTLAGEGAGTRMTWSFDADYGSSIMGRYFGLLSDSMLGPDYEKGLGRLKLFVESLPNADFSGLQFESVASAGAPVVLLRTRSASDANAIGVALGVAHGKLSGYLSANGLKQAGPPLATYVGESEGMLNIDAAIPVEELRGTPVPPIRAGRSFEGLAVKGVYRGDYSGLPAAREQVRAYMAAAGLTPGGPIWEQYISDPGSTPPGELVTNIHVPVR